MCTVTLIARRRGYALGMNRDEKLSRAKGLPPELRVVNGVKILCPSEPGGGTWIALNEHGATFALINWYSITTRAKKHPVSRGEVVLACSRTSTSSDAQAALARLALLRTNPFRLIGIFPHDREVIEWRWNLRRLERVKHPWRAQQWISSGFDESEAQRIRSQTFRAASRQKSFGTPRWLRRLHRSHAPGCGPFSTCMHRTDAATVSYTEILLSSSTATMRHASGPPCEASARTLYLRTTR